MLLRFSSTKTMYLKNPSTAKSIAIARPVGNARILVPPAAAMSRDNT